MENKIDNSNWDFDEIYSINKENGRKIIENESLEDLEEIIMPRKLSNDLRNTLKADDILALDN